jgi:hypothetical protein
LAQARASANACSGGIADDKGRSPNERRAHNNPVLRNLCKGKRPGRSNTRNWAYLRPYRPPGIPAVNLGHMSDRHGNRELVRHAWNQSWRCLTRRYWVARSIPGPARGTCTSSLAPPGAPAHLPFAADRARIGSEQADRPTAHLVRDSDISPIRFQLAIRIEGTPRKFRARFSFIERRSVPASQVSVRSRSRAVASRQRPNSRRDLFELGVPHLWANASGARNPIMWGDRASAFVGFRPTLEATPERSCWLGKSLLA